MKQSIMLDCADAPINFVWLGFSLSLVPLPLSIKERPKTVCPDPLLCCTTVLLCVVSLALLILDQSSFSYNISPSSPVPPSAKVPKECRRGEKLENKSKKICCTGIMRKGVETKKYTTVKKYSMISQRFEHFIDLICRYLCIYEIKDVIKIVTESQSLLEKSKVFFYTGK